MWFPRRQRSTAFLCLLLTTGIVDTVVGFGSSPTFSAIKIAPFPVTALMNSRKTEIIRATRSLYKPKGGDKVDIMELDREVLALEKEINESTKAKLDLKRVSQMIEDDENRLEARTHFEAWQVSLAARGVAAAATLGITDSLALAGIALAGVYVTANGDPLEEQSPVGAAARVVGRATLSSIEMVSPKIKALARVSIQGDEQVATLKERIRELEAENKNLRQWQKRRNFVDDASSMYTVTQLKSMARDRKLPVGGSKTELLMRLVEADVLQP